MADRDEDTGTVKEADVYRIWMNRITDALKREKKFRMMAKRCVELYEAKEPEKTPFAILYSNTETLAPAVYNARPIPIVDRRFKDADPVGKLAADVATRILKFEIDAESEDYDSFDELMQPAVLDVLITNRGLTRFKYEADTSNGKVSNECVYGEAVRWDKFFHGYARTWKKVPWIGFEWDMDKREVQQNFGDEITNQIDFTRIDPAQDTDDKTDNSGETREEMTGAKLIKVYEIWDKSSKKVYFFSPAYPNGPLKVLDDPLELSSFFPIPKPLNFMRKVSTLVPTPLYIQYESQAKELNEITRRLKAIIRALKVRGFYNKDIEGIDKVLQAEDNVLVPVENMASMPEGTAADKMIWLMPLAELSTTAQNLYQQREQVKQVIYEITGISDILRGASVASETATAQNIKNQWGTLRLKKMQKEVMRYCRDSLRIILEISVTKFGIDTVAAMTGLQFPTKAQKAKAQAAAQQFMQQAMATQQAPQLPAPGQDPSQMAPPQPQQPPQLPPELQQVLNSPTWEDILGVLKNDVMRAYRVDIETNSTIDAEASQDKQDISELLNALSQFLNGVAPLIQEGVLPFDVAKTMMLAISRRFTFGPQLEDSLQQMTAPQKPEDKPDPAEQMKLQVLQEQAKVDTAKSQMELQKMQQEQQMVQQNAAMEMQVAQAELEIKKAELDLKRQELGLQAQMLQMKNEASMQQHQIKMSSMAEKAEFDKKQREQQAKEPANATV